ncbi:MULTISPECIES: ABC transporter permease [Brevibacillus]|jgi:peptide/nickel transport system permease protein|uniref:Peptide/nickel transport system permease protein n=1 Tax=Brevibacillus centrosporus TaxID=54910 RepID=A0A1I4B1Q5_9BACL|nr:MULTISPECIES: ABC transporter permease subunit [Brevibacillus]MDR7317834.1 peptide/nickel transport system permease protein [Brevibacillus nitrificans]MEC2131618.1 ABC transporter permease subunit [Brevibacillus centrosporus]MED4907862.1 ABC transporter permease subunit [Brevibacillus centrosporus]RNB72106.1 ABC transporter permease subunit [Brevibacillus centrosporus]SFK61849.1 peptide/nickel transport system permease protein [Brevibacillus centrosporus]
MQKRMNWSLWIGAFLVLLLLIVGVIGPYVAPYELDFQEKLRNEVVGGKTVIISPPLPPSDEHAFGTDKWGYDMLTLLLHGAPYTVFVTLAIALVRLVIGMGIGLYIGVQDKPQRWWLAIENAWSYMPIFIPVYFLLKGVSINPLMPTSTLVALFIGVVAVLGAPSVASSIRQKTEQIKETQYVLAATSLGAGREQIIFRHIVPHLKEQLIIILVTEMVAIMTLMGLLGMFDLFVGGTKMTMDPVLYHSITHEWAGLLGSYRGFVYSNYTWIFLTPLVAFVWAIGSFTLLAKGLREKFEQTYHRTPFI